MDSIIKIQDISYIYENREHIADLIALKNVSLEIERGSFVAILGHNGSGKSTLAKCLNATLVPSGGKIFVENMDTANEDLTYSIREKAGMVFQNPDNQIVATVVEEDVAFAPENMGLPQEEIRRRVDFALETVGMSEFKKHAPHLLSGGQKQRIAIAGVLAMAPEIIVLDEPTAMLDPSGRAEVMATIMELKRERGMTIILITHHMDEAAQADRVVVMEDGMVIDDGTPSEIFSKVEKMYKTGLGVPQTVEILNELKSCGAHLDVDALSVDECAARLMNYLED